jgi:hypothetical protein
MPTLCIFSDRRVKELMGLDITNLIIGMAGIVFGGIGIGYAAYINRTQARERKYAIHEMNNVYSQLCHIEWWIRNDPTPQNREALANRIVSLLHSIRITLNNSAKRYGGSLEEINPFAGSASQGEQGK